MDWFTTVMGFALGILVRFYADWRPTQQGPLPGDAILIPCCAGILWCFAAVTWAMRFRDLSSEIMETRACLLESR